ncbi:MAG TPA: hypothetical protein VG737_05735 [Cyclobacteriaceae bacterium]|nr:hypothetical protein [Cyclobacteriaceae bacterium]
MKYIRNSTGLAVWALALLLCFSACKSKKKAMEAAAAEKARMEQEARQKKEDEDRKKREAEEAENARKEQEEAARREAEAKASTPKAKLGKYFDGIANAASTASANSSINEALAMFASPETPVLIIISGSGDQKDYDRPTTIKDYLNYLKDQKKNINKIENLQIDASGKITEVELRK